MSIQHVDHDLARRDGLHALRVAIAQAADQAKALHEAGDLEALAAGLSGLRPLLADLRTLARDVEDYTADLMPTKRMELEGRVLERRKGSDRRAWRWDEVLTVSLPVLIERNEGSVMDALGELVQMLPLTSSTGPRLAAFRDLGFDPDEFCESKPGRVTVQIIEGGA